MGTKQMKVREADFVRFQEIRDERKPIWLSFEEMLNELEEKRERIQELEKLESEMEDRVEDLGYRISTLEEYIDQE